MEKFEVRRYDTDPTAPFGTIVSSHASWEEACAAVADWSFKYRDSRVERGPNYVMLVGSVTYAAVVAEYTENGGILTHPYDDPPKMVPAASSQFRKLDDRAPDDEWDV